MLHRGPLDEPVGAPQESLRCEARSKYLFINAIRVFSAHWFSLLLRSFIIAPIACAAIATLRQAKRDKALHGSLVAQDEDVVMIRSHQ